MSFGEKVLEKPECDQDPDSVSQKIYDSLSEDRPCMIARFGAFELNTVVNFLGVRAGSRNIFKYIRGDSLQWWWNKKLIQSMNTNAGFFPPTEEKIEKFCELMLKDIPEVDVLGSWLPGEHYFEKEIGKEKRIRLIFLDPFWVKQPWTKALEGRKVLVIHPYTETIKKQYNKREFLFKNDILPEFELKTIQAVQSIAGSNPNFKDWFEALDFMKSEIDKEDYDICLIGAGAYGFPLAAHVKRSGKKAVHVGGSLQLFFGIRGKRWETDAYASVVNLNYPSLINEHWVRPSTMETPEAATNVENGCYW